ncbi:CD209 antigen-like protein C [Haliotis rufescens]|uniref:CD209 antigen-like protein C n=1 Tax=Haliotis rufescens TaxID=6454 RepID=UPI00201EF096|nr:CD209 antigen-like protein C [Haliotis rufescens]
MLHQLALKKMSSGCSMDGFVSLLVILGLTTGFNGCLCSCWTDGLIKAGKYLQYSDFAEVPHSSVFSCAAECYKYGICKSFNFNKKTKSCSLNYEDDVLRSENLIAADNRMYSKIEGWPKVRIAGACMNQICAKHEKCVLTRVASSVCETSPSYGVTYTTEFIVSTRKLNWKDAAAECLRQHGTLAFVDTPTKQQEIEDLMKGKGVTDFVWLGASRVEEEDTWKWLDGRKLNFKAWSRHNSQPNNYGGNQDCLAVIYKDATWSDWFDNVCLREFYFMCEFIRKL